MKKLALVTDAWTPQINGVVTTLKQMVQRAEENGWEVQVIHPGLKSFSTIPTPSYPEIRTVTNPWALGSVLDADITSMHIATEGSLGASARVMAWSRDWYYTSGFHTNFADYTALRTGIDAKRIYPILRWFHSRSKAVLVPSQSTKNKLDALGFENVKVWSRGFDETIFYPPANAIPVRDKPMLLNVGRVAVEKNLEELLKLSDRYNIVIVGDGPDRAKLSAKYPLAMWAGYREGEELAEFYRHADCFVFPSLTDTFGIVMVEAMACGLPVAAHHVEGPKDVIVNGGVLAEDLEVAIKRALELKGTSAPLENASRYSWRSSAETFYGSLVRLNGERF